MIFLPQLLINPKSTEFNPRETAFFNIKTKSDSLVSLLAVDQSIRFIGTKNEITSEEVNKKLSTLNNPTTDNAILLQLSTAKRLNCFAWEEEFDRRAVSLHQGLVTIPTLTEDEFQELEREIETFEPFEPAESLLRKYFPDVWIFETIEAKSPVVTYSQMVPDTITNWTISGFSIHPQHGLAIAQPTNIRVFQDFFIKTGIPNSVKIGEVFKIDVTVYNYLDNRQDVQVFVDTDNRELEMVEEKQIYGKPGCFEYKRININSKNLKIESQSQGSFVVLARALKSGKIPLKIEAAGQDVSDKVEKVVKVDYEGVTQFTNKPLVVDLTRNAYFREEVTLDIPDDVEPTTVKIEASISGNLLGPLLDGVERFM